MWCLRRLVNLAYGADFPVEPGGRFPASVLDPGAFPSTAYDLAFWGFPCVLYSGLQRHATPEDLQWSLALLERALDKLRQNPPRVFVLENTASLLALPDVLSQIEDLLESLPYDWRWAATPPFLPFSPRPRRASTPPLSTMGRCALLCPHADAGADVMRPRIWWVGFLE